MRTGSRNWGFTLVELLVATVLLAVGLAAVAAAFSAATRAQAAALRTTTAARLAQAKLAEIEATGTTSGGEEGTFAELETDQTPGSGDLGDYSYRWEVATDDSAGLARAQVSVWYRDNERSQFTLVCYLPAAGGAP
jgi:prepilin-type N-terminal cleavage/methylation domain-containing protein